MRVDKLLLEDFRNYHEADVEFAPELNVVIGRNAQGKTNLLEAIHYLSGLGSPRSSEPVPIREGCRSARLHADVVTGSRALRFDIELRGDRPPRALVNGTPVPGTRSLTEIFVAVFFGPDDVSLVKGSPERRRRFFDDLVVKLRPARLPLRREWERVLKQRNALLRTVPADRGARRAVDETLGVWDQAFCRAGAELTAARLEALGALAPFASKRYEEIAGGGALELTYESEWLEPGRLEASGVEAASTEALREVLERKVADVRGRELERKVSLVGPQRDDLRLGLASSAGAGGTLDARTFASQGDQRTCALALKLAEHDLLSDALDDEPVLLLDDVFSELDAQRRSWLADAVRGRGQTVLSSAERLEPDVVGEARVLEIVAGSVSRA